MMPLDLTLGPRRFGGDIGRPAASMRPRYLPTTAIERVNEEKRAEWFVGLNARVIPIPEWGAFLMLTS